MSSATTTDASLPSAISTQLPFIGGTNKTVDPLVCTALKQWFNSLNGNTWIMRTGWDSSDMSTCCSWYNVHCNSIGQVLKV
jgi:hypothetical protein